MLVLSAYEDNHRIRCFIHLVFALFQSVSWSFVAGSGLKPDFVCLCFYVTIAYGQDEPGYGVATGIERSEMEG